MLHIVALCTNNIKRDFDATLLSVNVDQHDRIIVRNYFSLKKQFVVNCCGTWPFQCKVFNYELGSVQV